MSDAAGPAPVCSACPASPACVTVDGRPLCDRCADREIAQATGWPQLPPPHPPEVIVGADGERHVFRYRIFRWPGRVVAIADEVGRAQGGHRLEVGADHFEDPGPLLERIRAAARSAAGRVQLTRDEQGQLLLEGSEVTGRLEGSDDPYELPRVVIDGRPLSWEEFGELLSPTTGWSFRLTLGGDTAITSDARSARTLALDDRARLMLRREPPRWFVVSLEHYPSPSEWQARPVRDGLPSAGDRRS